ncbi:MAG TPA: DksA/TraR family C4-type zinc finger protein [Gammaproteobacteria bacterium]|nr:DksA/TraR family C4-type zinc finger protein [Gammaproteobacteria bacterium]
MASGWAKDGAVQDQIDASIEDALKSVRARLPQGAGLSHCEECGNEIPAARRAAVPGVRLCLACQSEADHQVQTHSLYNRRGSKDSQLR